MKSEKIILSILKKESSKNERIMPVIQLTLQQKDKDDWMRYRKEQLQSKDFKTNKKKTKMAANKSLYLFSDDLFTSLKPKHKTLKFLIFL